MYRNGLKTRLVLAFAVALGFAQSAGADEWTGAYVGVHAGYGESDVDWEFQNSSFFNFLPGDRFAHKQEGTLAGAQVGWNQQFNTWVFGVDVALSRANISRASISPFFPAFDVLVSDIDTILTATSRVGYLTNPNFLMYVSGGYAGANLTIRADDNLDFFEETRWVHGWTIGGGFEHRIMPGVTIGVDYKHLRLTDARFNGTVTGGLGQAIVDAGASINTLSVRTNILLDRPNGHSGGSALPSQNRRITARVQAHGGYVKRTGPAINESGGITEDDSLPLIGIVARARVSASPAVSAQFDLDTETAFVEGPITADTYSGKTIGTAHLTLDANALTRVGIFVGGGQAYNANQFGGDEETQDVWFAGGEWMQFFGATTLYAQAGYLDSRAPDPEQLQNAWFIRGVGRAFLNNDRTMFQGELAYASGEQDTDATPSVFVDNVDLFAWGFRAEQQFDGLQLGDTVTSVFAAYNGHRIEEMSGGTGNRIDLTDHMIRVGLVVQFGGATLLDVDRYGPSLDTPDIGRWIAATTAVD